MASRQISYYRTLATTSYFSCLCLLAVLAIASNSAYANHCTITDTIEPLGNRNNPRSHTFSSMSRIESVTLLRVRGDNACPAGSYSYTDNILSTAAGCRGDFRVVGLRANCSNTHALQISSVPLYIAQSSQPNIMFLLDDSGSMHFEIMPDKNVFFTENNGAVTYLYPRASGVYGSSDYSNHVATVDGDKVFNAITRSPQQNTIYYNPGVTYTPWIKSDGTSYPAASPSCALHNPINTGTGASKCRDLTSINSNYNNNTWHSCNSSGSCSASSSNKNFWPALYYWYSGDDPRDLNNYSRTEIRSSISTYSGHDRINRSDCADAENSNCSYAEEIQNFANWYTYYRSRILAARAGIGFAFAQQGSNMRVGFGTINKGDSAVDTIDSKAVSRGVRTFSGADRDNFFNDLYTRDIPAAGTPLRLALDAAGKYFSRSDNRGPWGKSPGSDDSTEHLSCRRSYTVLTTDGYWSGGDSYDADTASARSNNDGNDGDEITGSVDQTYTYTAASPFTDEASNTLADVAMYYWKNDLRPDLANEVVTTPKNPAFWQHMTTFGVGLGVTGTIDPASAFAAIDDSDTSIAWPDTSPSTQNCADNVCPARIDDLLHASVNSRGGFFSATNPNAFAAELASILQAIAVETRSSASSTATNSTRLESNSRVYQASFDSNDWSSQIVAYSLTSTGALDSEVWNTSTPGLIPSAADRAIFTGIGTGNSISTSATNFTEANWDLLTDFQQNALQDSGTVAHGKNVLNWLRGDQSLEGTNGFRTREVILGDIVNSSPIFVGDHNSNNFGFNALPGTEGSSYFAFQNSDSGKGGRQKMLYVGANDGMLHGFNADTGAEVFAYIPIGVYENLALLSHPSYEHRYYVDASPRVSDAYLSGSWKTILVASTGAGGRSVFALDITDPDNMSASKFLWEFSTANDANDKLGVALSEPVIARVKAGNQWVAIFGNGFNSNDTIKLFVVNLATGELITAIDTGYSGDNNGLASVVPLDIGGDKITDYVYAGDLQGNLWKFDLSTDLAADWDVSRDSNNEPQPLFVATDANGNRQPITTRPVVGKHASGSPIILFGTGSYFTVADGITPSNPQIQSFYGIRDLGAAVSRGDLLAQSIEYQGSASFENSGDTITRQVRTVSNNQASASDFPGWYINLIPPNSTSGYGERSVSSPLLRDGRIIFNTIIPDSNACRHGGKSWLMEMDANNGGRFDYSVFDLNRDRDFDTEDYIELNSVPTPVSGLGYEELTETPSVIRSTNSETKYMASSKNNTITEAEKASSKLGRQSWRQLQ